MNNNEKENKSTVTSYRLTEEAKSKIKQQINDMGLTQEKYFDKITTLMELENTKKNNLFSVNATEVEDLTKRLYNIFINMCEQGNSFLSNKAVEIQELKSKYKDMLSEKENIITEQKEKLQSVNTINNVLQNENEDHKIETMKIKSDYEKQIEQLNNNIQDKNLLVEEYKGKNDMLSGQLKQYEKLPEQLDNVKTDLVASQSTIIKLNDKIKELNYNIDNLSRELKAKDEWYTGMELKYENSLKEIKESQVLEIESIKDKAEFEKDKVILQLKTEHQKELSDIKQKYNEEIEEYQNKYKDLLKELEVRKTEE